MQALLGLYERLSVRERSILMVTIGVAFLALVYALMYVPVSGNLAENEDERERLIKLLAQRVEDRKKAEDLAEQYGMLLAVARSEEDVDHLRRELTAEISDLADEAGVLVNRIGTVDEKAEGAVVRLTVPVRINCSPGQLAEFLYALKNSKYIMDVRSMNLTAKGRTYDLNADLDIARAVLRESGEGQ